MSNVLNRIHLQISGQHFSNLKTPHFTIGALLCRELLVKVFTYITFDQILDCLLFGINSPNLVQESHLPGRPRAIRADLVDANSTLCVKPMSDTPISTAAWV